MHPGPPPQSSEPSSAAYQVCGMSQTAKSCAKICLVKVYPQDQRDKAINMYVILDDQSNRSLARSDFFDLFNVNSSSSTYFLRTCAGTVNMSGRKAEGFQVESLSGDSTFSLPPLIECNQIPNNRSEIPTPEAALHHLHLKRIAAHIPKLDPEAEILLLLGRDIIRVHKVRQHINGPHCAPFAQKLDLGWVLVGEVCLGNAHKPDLKAFKTTVLENGRPNILNPCENSIHLKEEMSQGLSLQSSSRSSRVTEKTLGQTVFNTTNTDNKLAPSIEDTIFLEMMDNDVYRDETNSWVDPLPFRVPRERLPNNRKQALTRLLSLRKSLDRKPEMKEQFVASRQRPI